MAGSGSNSGAAAEKTEEECVVIRFSYVLPNDHNLNKVQSYLVGSGVIHTDVIFPQRRLRVTVNMTDGIKKDRNFRPDHEGKSSNMTIKSCAYRPHEYYAIKTVPKNIVENMLTYIDQQESEYSGYDTNWYLSQAFGCVIPNCVADRLATENKQTCARFVYSMLRHDTVCLLSPELYIPNLSIRPDLLFQHMARNDNDFVKMDETDFFLMFEKNARSSYGISMVYKPQKLSFGRKK
jgi:hypothetical protein